MACARVGHTQRAHDSACEDAQRGSPAPERSEAQPGRDERCTDRGDDAKAQLDHRAHTRVLMHVHQAAAVVCGDYACERDDSDDDREMAAVAAQLAADPERAHPIHATKPASRSVPSFGAPGHEHADRGQQRRDADLRDCDRDRERRSGRRPAL
ncbi:MAG: hypothetical protein LC790_19395 [Actinobacteria bacterium]|nr:hypothetical protein [Actinomycetota bacterium]